MELLQILWFYFGRIVFSALSLFQTVLIVRAILSWIPPVRRSRFFWVLDRITEPFLRPIRNVLRKISWLREVPIDFSSLILFIIIDIAMMLLGIVL
jgi:YggT family protein